MVWKLQTESVVKDSIHYTEFFVGATENWLHGLADPTNRVRLRGKQWIADDHGIQLVLPELSCNHSACEDFTAQRLLEVSLSRACLCVEDVSFLASSVSEFLAAVETIHVLRIFHQYLYDCERIGT